MYMGISIDLGRRQSTRASGVQDGRTIQGNYPPTSNGSLVRAQKQLALGMVVSFPNVVAINSTRCLKLEHV